MILSLIWILGTQYYLSGQNNPSTEQTCSYRGTNASQQDNAGYTGLHYAARSGHLHIVRLLVQVEESEDMIFCNMDNTNQVRWATFNLGWS